MINGKKKVRRGFNNSKQMKKKLTVYLLIHIVYRMNFFLKNKIQKLQFVVQI